MSVIDLYDVVRLDDYSVECMVIAIIRFKSNISPRSVIVDCDFANGRDGETLQDYIDELDFEDFTIDYINDYLTYKNFGVAGFRSVRFISSGAKHRVQRDQDKSISNLGKFLSGIDKVKNHTPGNSGLEFL